MPNSRIPLNERGVEDAFRRTIERRAQDKNWAFNQFSLAGADRDLADAVITAGFRYALVEFKFTQEQLEKEGRKELREVLCVALSLTESEDIPLVHDACHFASWLDESSGECLINIYRKQFCNLQIFPRSRLLKSNFPDTAATINAKDFARALFEEETAALSLEEFQSYVDWMRAVQLAEGGQVTGKFTIVAFDPVIETSRLITGDDFVLLDNYLREIAVKLSHQQMNTPPTGGVPPGSKGP